MKISLMHSRSWRSALIHIENMEFGNGNKGWNHFSDLYDKNCKRQPALSSMVRLFDAEHNSLCIYLPSTTTTLICIGSFMSL